MNLSHSRTRVHAWLVVGVFCAFFFFYGLATFGVVGADEPRYAQIAREMLARHDWVSPTLYGRVWLEKPALYYWSAMISYRAFGISDWTARIPVALFALMMVAGLYLYMRRFRPGGELQTALIACSSVGIFSFARAGSTDMPLASCFTLGLLAWMAWFETEQKKWLLAFYFFMAGGTLAKGPIAPLLAGLIIFCFALLRKDVRLVVKTLWAPGILVFLLTALPWYVLVQVRNPQFFDEFILRQNLARFGTNLYRHEEPFWYFAAVLLVALFPWALLALAAWTRVLRNFFRERLAPQSSAGDLERFMAIWAILPVIFFSFSKSKLPGYILPAIPAWVLLTALYLARQTASNTRSRGLWIAHAFGVSAAATLVILAPKVLLVPNELHSMRVWSLPLLAAAMVALSLAGLAFWRGWQALFAGTLCVAVAGLGVLLRTAAPIIDATQSARPVARYLENNKLPVLVFHVPRGIQYGLGFYFNREVPNLEAGNYSQSEHLLLAKKGDLKEVIELTAWQLKQKQNSSAACPAESQASVLHPDPLFRSPGFDLYQYNISSPSSCHDGLPMAEKRGGN